MKKITTFVHGMQRIYAAIPTFDKIVLFVLLFILTASLAYGFMQNGNYVLFVVCLLLTALAGAEWERQSRIYISALPEEQTSIDG